MSATFSLTPRQRDAFNFIVRYMSGHDGDSPSYEEIRAALGLSSKSGVTRLVGGLMTRGLLRKLPSLNRSLTLVTEPADALPSHLQARLAVYCAGQGERYDAVLADAVSLFLDERDRDIAIEEQQRAPAEALS